MSDYEKVNITELNQRLDAGWDVYQHYMGMLGYGLVRPYKKYKSPFREERHPSFQIYRHRRSGVFWHTDFAYEKAGNHWTFVQRLFNISDFWEAVSKVRRDIFGEVGGVTQQSYNRVIYAPVKEEVKARSEVRIEVSPREWNKLDTDYWDLFNASGLVGEPVSSIEELERLHMRPISGFRLTTSEKDVSISEKPGDPIYDCYFSSEEKETRHKMYRPLTANRKFKFGPSNVIADDDLFGFHLLPRKCKNLFITAGQKDTFAFRMLTGLPCFPLNSENAKMPDWLPNFLSLIADNVYTVLNNDFGKTRDTGQEGTDYLSSFGYRDARAPLLQYEANDVADLVHALKHMGASEHLLYIRNYYLSL
jgi:hypothetical protein